MLCALRVSLIGLIVLGLAACGRNEIVEPTQCAWVWSYDPPPEPEQRAIAALAERGIPGRVAVTSFGEDFCEQKGVRELAFHFAIPVADLADGARRADLTRQLQLISEEAAGEWKNQLNEMEITFEQGAAQEKVWWDRTLDSATLVGTWSERKQ